MVQFRNFYFSGIQDKFYDKLHRIYLIYLSINEILIDSLVDHMRMEEKATIIH